MSYTYIVHVMFFSSSSYNSPVLTQKSGEILSRVITYYYQTSQSVGLQPQNLTTVHPTPSCSLQSRSRSANVSGDHRITGNMWMKCRMFRPDGEQGRR